MTVRTGRRRCVCRLALFHWQSHLNSTAFVVLSVGDDSSAKRFDNRDAATALGFPIGRTRDAHAVRNETRARIMYGEMQRIIHPMRLGTERSRSVPLHVADEFAHDLLDNMNIAVDLSAIGDVRTDCAA
jgi:hypothetical protein